MRVILAMVCALLLQACSGSDFVESTVLTHQESRTMRSAVASIAKGDSAAMSRTMVPTLAQQLRPVLPAMQRQLPQGPFKVRCLGASKRFLGPDSLAEAIYEVEGGQEWALVRAQVQNTSGRTLLTAIYVEKVPTAPRNLNGFRLRDAGVGGWAMLAGMACAVVLTITALIRIWRSGLFQRRWLWTIGAVLGFTTFRLNWTTGAWAFQPISFQLFSISAFKQPIFEPWVLAVSVPVVAIVVLFRHRKKVVGEVQA